MDGQPQDLIPLHLAAERLRVTRATMWRKTHELGLTVYSDPADKRKRLLSWSEIQNRIRPIDTLVVASGEGTREGAMINAYAPVFERSMGLRVQVLPESDDFVRARMLSRREIDTFAAPSTVVEDIIQANGPFAASGMGPLPVRDWFPTVWYGVSTGFLSRADDGPRSIWDIGKGTRIADVSRQVVVMGKVYDALLAWLGLRRGDVVMVPYGSIRQSLIGLANGEVDVTHALPLSEAAFTAEGAPHGLHWLDLNPNASPRDEEGARRFTSVVPNVVFKQNWEGVPSSIGCWALGMTSGYTCRLVHASTPEDFVYGLAKSRGERFATGQYSRKMADPVEYVKAALQEIILPVHEGAVRFFREAGIWTDRDDTRQRYNLWVLNSYATAWQEATERARHEGVRIDPRGSRWMTIWREQKASLPRLCTRTDNEIRESLNYIDTTQMIRRNRLSR